MQEKSSKNNSETLKFLSFTAGKNKWLITVLTAIQMLLGASGVLFAFLLKYLVNSAIERDKEKFLYIAFGFTILALIQIILAFAKRYLTEYIKSDLENGFKKRLFNSLLCKDFSAVSAVHSAKWMNNLTSDTVIVANHITTIIPNLAGMTVQLLSALVALIVLEPRLAYLLLPAGVILLVFSTIFRKKMKALHKKVQESDGELRERLQEQLAGMTVVRSYAVEDDSLSEAEIYMGKHKKARMSRCNFSNFCNLGFGLLMKGMYVLGAIFCGYGILQGKMLPGNLVAVMQLVTQVQSPMANISGFIPQYYSMIASAERLMEAEQLPSESSENCESRENALDFYNNKFKSIKFDNVDFKYQSEDAKVLSGFSAEIKKGAYVALTGHSGCGKSTVFRLILSLYRPQKGSCCLTDTDGQNQSLRKYRRLFAYVPQGKFFLSGSIRDIVSFADKSERQDDEKLRKALIAACADEFIEETEHGLDTVIGELGLGLSEGQLQRLSIARAIFSDCPVLLLDEATSALDDETERKVLENLKSMTDKTVLIVTHRKAALEICDNIIKF